MRLITWNANFNNKKRSLEADVALLRSLSPDVPPDIIVLSETAAPAAGNPLNAVWIGNRNPGLAVIAEPGWELIPDPANTGALKHMAGFSVRGKNHFDLLAIWPAPEPADGKMYHQTLMAALERYSHLLTSGRAIMAGDFNSNSRISFQKTTHPQFVKAAESLGIASVYHTGTREPHGGESQATYRRHYSKEHTFHIDYCFASLPLADKAKLKIESDANWDKLSDHYPLILDIDDSLLGQNSQL